MGFGFVSDIGQVCVDCGGLAELEHHQELVVVVGGVHSGREALYASIVSIHCLIVVSI